MHSLEKVEVENKDSDEEEENEAKEEENEAKDPRAGKVDVHLPQIPFEPLKIAELLTNLKSKKYTSTLGRKKLNILSKQ